MKLSKNKIKTIKRNRHLKTPEELAVSLGVSVDQVLAVLSADGMPPGKIHLVSVLGATLHWGVWVLCGTAPLVFINRIHDFSRLPKMAFIQIATVTLLLAWAARGVAEERVSIKISPLAMAIASALLWVLVSTAYARNHIEGLFYWQHWAFCTAVFFLVANEMHRLRGHTGLLWAFTLAGVAIACLGIAQFLFGFSLINQVAPPAATFANRNMAAHFMVLAVPLTAGLFCINRRILSSWMLSVCMALMVTYVIYTRTRAAWLALAIECLVFLSIFWWWRRFWSTAIWPRHKLASFVVFLLLVLVMMNLGAGGSWKGFSEISERAAVSPKEITDSLATTSSATETSVSWRIGTWRNIMALIGDHPWTGVGLGNLKIAYPPYHRKIVHIKTFSETTQLEDAHNDYLQATAELGVIGAVLILVVCWCVASALRQAIKTAENNELKTIALSLGVAFVGIAISAGLSFPFQRSIPPLVVMVLVGLLAGMSKTSREWAVNGRVLPALLAVVFFGLLALEIHEHRRLIQSDRQLYAMPMLNAQEKWRDIITRKGTAYLKNADQYKILAFAAGAHIALGEHRHALQILDTLISVFPHVTNYHYLRGMAHAAMGSYDAAMTAFHQVLAIKPDFPDIHVNMAKIYMLRGQFEQALAAYETAASLDSENSRIRFDQGIAATRLARHADAAAAFEAAVALNPDWALAHKNLGILYIQFLGKTADGVAHLKTALALNPDIPGADGVHRVIQDHEKAGP